MSKDLIIQMEYFTDYLKNRIEKVPEESKKSSSMPMAHQSGVYAGLLDVTVKNLVAWRKALETEEIEFGEAFYCQDCERFIWANQGHPNYPDQLCQPCGEKALEDKKVFEAMHSSQAESGL